jgi:hypothetical protein
VKVDTDDLCTAVDIANMAGVYPSAVSNWIARHADFPKPVFERPRACRLFLWSEVREWLTTPRTVQVQLPAKVITRQLPARIGDSTNSPQ